MKLLHSLQIIIMIIILMILERYSAIVYIAIFSYSEYSNKIMHVVKLKSRE